MDAELFEVLIEDFGDWLDYNYESIPWKHFSLSNIIEYIYNADKEEFQLIKKIIYTIFGIDLEKELNDWASCKKDNPIFTKEKPFSYYVKNKIDPMSPEFWEHKLEEKYGCPY